MFSNNIFLIGFGTFYGVSTTLFSIFIAKIVSNFFKVNIYRSDNFFLKILGLGTVLLTFIGGIFLFIYLSWLLPIEDGVWAFFASPYKILIWLTLVLYFKKKRESNR